MASKPEVSEARRDGTSIIEVIFGAPVELSREHQKRLVGLIDEICEAYEDAHQDRVMWAAGIGDRPSGIWTDEPSFDSSVFQIDCCERERFDDEKRHRTPWRNRHAVVEAWLGVHAGMQRMGMESEAIDTLVDYFDSLARGETL